MARGWRDQYTRYREFYLNILNAYKQKADLRAFLEIILSLSTISIFTIFAIRPTVITIIGLVREIEEKRTTLAALEQKVRNLELAGDIYVQNQDVIPVVESAISTLPAPQDLSKQVLALAAFSSVDVMGISVGQVTLLGDKPDKKAKTEFKPLPGDAYEMPFSVSVRGSYADIMLFLSKFETLRIPSKIDQATINSAQTENGTVIVSVISGRVPYLGEK